MTKEIKEKNSLLKEAAGKAGRVGLDALFVSDEKDVLYLAGCSLNEARLVVCAKGRPAYFIDKMNESLARKALKGLEADIMAGSLNKMLKGFIRENKLRKIGINEKSLFAYEEKALRRGLKGVKFKSASGVLEDMRKEKNPHEVKTLKKAAKETLKLWRKISRSIRLGMTEREVASMLDSLIAGSAYKNSFPTIAAFGKNTAYPHAFPTNKRLKRGEHVLLDFGIQLGGYSSDLTRIYHKGRINGQIMGFYKCVREAQGLAIKEIRPGRPVSSVARKVNRLFKERGFEEFVLHGLGHGVGLNVHEKPFLVESSKDLFREGMVVTVEPGLYKEGLGGVRVEDMVLVTKKGCEVLTV